MTMTELTDGEIEMLERVAADLASLPMPTPTSDLMLRLISEVKRRRLEQGWLPIEGAPKDGVHILACDAVVPFNQHWTFNHRPPTVVHWFEDGFYTSVNEREPQHPFRATHWKHLDAPPPGTGG